jgi:CheY-like chemotaxis protein/HPt (histidine-containing phosphotransfer) domain-containing protein
VKFIAPNAKILIVDDIYTNLKVAEGLLLPSKARIDLCMSGAEAVEAAKASSFDLVFMDHMMPEMDGIEATKYIREFSDVPIIALTANAVSGTKEMFMANGFNDFLSKPVDTIKLNVVLEKWLPKEKQKKATEEVNVEKGVDLQLLAIFHKDGVQKIEEIKKCLEVNNYSLYTIYVHALKSATANVGASALSEAAKDLEMAGKRGDFDFIHSHNSVFLAELQTLLDSINETLLANKEKNREKTVDFKTLKSELCKLKEAIGVLDFRAMNEAAKILQEFTQADKVGATVEGILQNKLIGEYDEAIFMIDSLLRDIDLFEI